MNEKSAGLLSVEASLNVVRGLKDAVATASTKVDKPRSHLGCSILGRSCDRAVWYSFRWASRIEHSPRLQRIFERGHTEEDRMLNLLRAAGIEVIDRDEDGNQIRARNLPAHVGGSLDAIAVLPAAITGLDFDLRVVVECKTHGKAQYAQVVKQGVQKAFYTHYVQGTMYAASHGIAYVLYMAKDKNDESIHFELYPTDYELFERQEKRATNIVRGDTDRIFGRVARSHTAFACKFCDHHDVCHKGAAPKVSCRTCRFSRPEGDGTWYCGKWSATIPTVEHQVNACPAWEQYD